MKARIERVEELMWDNARRMNGFSRCGVRIIIEGKNFRVIIDTVRGIIAVRCDGLEESIRMGGEIVDFLNSVFDDIKDLDVPDEEERAVEDEPENFEDDVSLWEEELEEMRDGKEEEEEEYN